MIIKDPIKKEIKDQYISSILNEKLKASEINEIKKTIVDNFNLKNRNGILRLYVEDSHKNALGLEAKTEDFFIKNDDILSILVKEHVFDKEEIKKTINDIVKNFVEESVEAIDFSSLDNDEHPYLIYFTFIDPDKKN